MNSINFIEVNATQLEQSLRTLKIVRVIALISLVVIAALSVVVFVINITLPLSSIQKQEQTTLANLSSLHDKLVKYSFVNDRITNIKSVISKRKDYSSVAGAVTAVVPAELTIDSFSIETKELSLTVSSSSLLPINEFIDAINNLGSQGKVLKNVKIDGLIMNGSSGKYSLTMHGDIL